MGKDLGFHNRSKSKKENPKSKHKNTFSKKLPKNNLFRPTPFYLDTLFSLNEDSNALQIKGILYSICAEFDSAAEYTECKNKEEHLLMIHVF